MLFGCTACYACSLREALTLKLAFEDTSTTPGVPSFIQTSISRVVFLNYRETPPKFRDSIGVVALHLLQEDFFLRFISHCVPLHINQSIQHHDTEKENVEQY